MQLALNNQIMEKLSVLDDVDQQLVAMIQNGLAISARPYEKIAEQIGISEAEIIVRISDLLERGLIKRFGVVLRHHELGYRQNAMVVWDVPDDQVDRVAGQMSSHAFVTLCYRRSRQLPEWPYNLFCMIHGKSRDKVMDELEVLLTAHNWHIYPHEVLFSKRRFKQRAANYISLAGCN